MRCVVSCALGLTVCCGLCVEFRVWLCVLLVVQCLVCVGCCVAV